MKLMNPVLYKHLRAFYQIANEKQALIYMGKDKSLSEEKYFDLKLKSSIVPIGVKMDTSIELNMNPNYIRACWLGRFVGFKYNAIKNVIVGLHEFCKKHSEITVHLDLIGYGDFENQIKQDCLNYACSNFIPEIKGEMIGDTLQTYLQKNVDLLCAHGTALLEGAKYGIPSLIVNGGLKQEKLDYLWLYDTPREYTGSMNFSPKGYPLEACLDTLKRSYRKIGQRCYRHADQYLSLRVTIRDFLNAVQRTQLTLQDLRKTKIIKHIFGVKIIEKIRSLKAIKHRIFYEKHGN